MTLIETLLAMVGVAVIGMAMASFLFATSHATETSKDMRGLVVKHKTCGARLNAAIRSSAMILDQGTDFIVLWIKDSDESGTPHLAEIRRIERDAVTRQLRSYVAPSTLAPADNAEYDLAATDFNAATNAIKGTANFPVELWANGVTNWTISLDDSDPQLAVLLSYRVTVQSNDLSEIVIGAAALRTPE